MNKQIVILIIGIIIAGILLYLFMGSGYSKPYYYFHVSHKEGYKPKKVMDVMLKSMNNIDYMTYKELKKAHEKGAEWCSTGFLKDKDKAYYPMQKAQSGCSYEDNIIIEYTPTDKDDVPIAGGNFKAPKLPSKKLLDKYNMTMKGNYVKF
ncbi:MAG: hypothetical protein ACOCP8_02330 [archaeon]